VVDRGAGLAIEEQLARAARGDVEHVGDRPGELVERAVADPAHVDRACTPHLLHLIASRS
jgi:hypothetical protein